MLDSLLKTHHLHLILLVTQLNYSTLCLHICIKYCLYPVLLVSLLSASNSACHRHYSIPLFCHLSVSNPVCHRTTTTVLHDYLVTYLYLILSVICPPLLNDYLVTYLYLILPVTGPPLLYDYLVTYLCLILPQSRKMLQMHP